MDEEKGEFVDLHEQFLLQYNRVNPDNDFEKFNGLVPNEITEQIDSGEVALYVPTKIIKSSCPLVLSPTRFENLNRTSFEIFNENNTTELYFFQTLSSDYFWEREIYFRITDEDLDTIKFPIEGIDNINLVGLMDYKTDENTINLFYESINI